MHHRWVGEWSVGTRRGSVKGGDPILPRMPLPDPDDIAPQEREKALSALAMLRIEEVIDPDGSAFTACYAMLNAFFGPRGEMEDRALLAHLVGERVIRYGDGLEASYHLVGVWSGDELVAARDCYVDLDRGLGFSIVGLSHAYIAPHWRRSGISALLRALPASMARRDQAKRLGRELPMLVAAEMEPVDPRNPDTIIRLLA